MSRSPLTDPTLWTSFADDYARDVRPAFEHYATEALGLAAPAPGAPIVDVACGPGTLAVLAARAGHPVDALDFSPGMIAQLEARRGELGGGRLTTHVGDGMALPFADGGFGAGFSMFGLMFFPDRARGFAELRRVLAPGARAVISTWCSLEHVPAMRAVFAAVAAALPDLPAGGPRPLETADACRAEMGAAFTAVEVHTTTSTRDFASTAALVDSLTRTMGPLLAIKRNLTADAWLRVVDSLHATLARELGTGPQAVPMPAWLTVGTAA